MKYRNLLLFMVFCYAINHVASRIVPSESIINSPYIEDFGIQVFNTSHIINQQQLKTGICDNLIIFDLTKNIVSKEIFDISIKIFLKFILEYCNVFKYISINDKYNGCENPAGCNITINECNSSNECEKIIEHLDYSSFLSSYPNDLYMESSNGYDNFLNDTFAKIVPCKDNSVLLLTNRIVQLNLDLSFLATFKKSKSKLMVILLGRNESTAADTLKKVYENFPNSTTLSLLNYDCLNYLFYCIIPCSNETPKCIATDISDCQYHSKITPNDNPRETLHVWYIFDFNMPIDRNYLLTILRNLHDGLQLFVQAQNISNIRVKAVWNNNDITESYEDLESTLHYAVAVVAFTGNIIDDANYANKRLSLIPWSGTLTETRIGILSIIILTNYAALNLTTEIEGQNLSGQMLIYDRDAFEYYKSNTLTNSTMFHLYFQDDIKDVIVFYPIQTDSFWPSTQKPTSISSSISSISSVATHSTLTVITSTVEHDQSKHSSNKTIIILISCGSVVGIVIFLVIAFFIYRKRKLHIKARQDYLNNEHRYSFTNDQWELTWDKLEILTEIGHGAYGQILQGKLQTVNQKMDDYEDVAIKMPSKLANEIEKKQFLNEINLMKKITGHSSIIKIFGCITIGNRICLILEFCQHFDLLKYVKKIKNDLVAENETDYKNEFLKFFWQISHGLKFIAEKGIVHRDLAARNILINSGKNAKITDFGLSIQLRDTTYVIPSRKHEKLPIKWLAIESFKDYKFSIKTDIWTFGIILYEMYSFGETPYEDVEAAKLLKYLENGNRLKKPNFCSNEIFEIMLKCWKENPFRRPTINELINNFTRSMESSVEGCEYLNVLKSSIEETDREME